MLYGFLSNFDTRIVAQRKDLQADELFAELFTKTITHITKELDSNNTVVFIGIIMGHLNNVLEYIVAPVLVGELVSDAT